MAGTAVRRDAGVCSTDPVPWGADRRSGGMVIPSDRSGGTGSRTGDFTGGAARDGVVTPGAGPTNGGTPAAVAEELDAVPGPGAGVGAGVGPVRPCFDLSSFWVIPLRGAANDGAMGCGTPGLVEG